MRKGILYNRVAIITGGSRGIGKEIAFQYAREGCHLVLVARGEKELRAATAYIKNKTQVSVEYFAFDISRESSAYHVVAGAISHFQKIDFLVNAASALGPVGPFEVCDSVEWEKALSVNIMGTFFMIKAVAPHMIARRYGSIINFSGGGAFGARPRFSAYSVSKAAVVRLTDAVAQELKEFGIIVNAISPGQINTNMFDEMVKAGEKKVGKEAWKEFEQRKKTGGDSIENVGKLAIFLVSEGSRKITGRVISAKWDMWENLPMHIDELAASDIYTMRRIKPEDYGKHW